MDDSSDDTIEFDDSGRCNYCRAASASPVLIQPAETKAMRLQALLIEMKNAGRDNKYDCIMGLSGGLDSSYLALMGYRWGLRVLAVHIDDGFDSDISKGNIDRLVDATGFDYVTINPDSKQFAGLTKAYLRAGVPNIAVPQDNVLFAFLHKQAKEHRIPYFASGGNFALESILQKGNTHTAYDLVNLRDINRKFGTTAIDRLPLLSTLGKMRDHFIGGIDAVRPLDLIDYRKDTAFQELREFSGFQYYGRKHLENHLTEFAQLYWFYHKFGVDKRTSHLSSLIVSGQMTRDQALDEYAKPIYSETKMKACIDLICSRLEISRSELDLLVSEPGRQHSYYATEQSRLWYQASLGLLRAARMPWTKIRARR
ncbi:MAG: hypothetical protein L0G71_05790 [Yaniella sp.]|nr:hypothetical protein [Yaniella sp.]